MNKKRFTPEELRERRRASIRRYYHANKAKCREANKRWYASLSPERRAELDKKKYKTRRRTVSGLRPRAGGIWSKPLFDLQVEIQSGLCAICKKPLTTKGLGKDAAVGDHDHETGQRRGVPCSNCNRGLGLFKDNPEALRAAALYLETDHEAIRKDYQRAKTSNAA